MAASFTAYRAALTTPGALVPVLSSALGRLPIAMFGLATLLYVQRVTRLVRAPPGWCPRARSSGVSLGSVVQGRLIDRIGPTRPLLVARGAVRGGRGRADRRRRGRAAAGRWSVLRALVAGLAQPALPGASRRPVGACWCRPAAAATRRTPTRRSAWRCSSSSGRPCRVAGAGALAGHRDWWWPRWRWCWGRWVRAEPAPVRDAASGADSLPGRPARRARRAGRAHRRGRVAGVRRRRRRPWRSACPR